ncbi:glutathione S-transferase PARB-like [Cornus florida]|uniref:glutathione S-transferase PARB-like n=1 Tax=Cornus florida TaxID=4283 RepID=UPI00289E4716|nr:glutathione S-transferase PARB-like [Cornus florida]
MAVCKLYGSIGSLATMRALASLFEHELEIEFIPIDLKTEQNKEEGFLSLSPFGQVPVFQDGELTIFESRAIMRCISHIYPNSGKEQIYMAPKMQGIVATWIDVEDHQFDPPASKLISELIEKPKNGLPTNEAAVAEEEAKLTRVLDVYEERLTRTKYLGGDKFTSADLTHLPNLYYLMATPMRRLFDKRVHVSAWCNDIMSRPAWSKVVDMVEKAKV